MITDQTPIGELLLLLKGPIQTFPADWWRWPNVREAHKALARQFIDELPPYPSDQHHGRGIVICAGGHRLFTNGYVCVNQLREHGCQLPIEFWHFADEVDDAMRDLVADFGVHCVNADEYRERCGLRIMNGWELKAQAILRTGFQEVLLLDADNVAVRDPSYLFDVEPYRRCGAVFWPDYGQLGPEREIWDVFETAAADHAGEHEFESGQLLIDKARSWRPLVLAAWMNEHSDYYYHFIHGDKCTFELAWKRLRHPYFLTPTLIHSLDATMCQHCPVDGQRLFQHRNMDKWSLDGSNRRIADFWGEDRCREFLADLRRVWSGRPFVVRVPSDSEARNLTAALEGQTLLYRRVGYDERPLTFQSEGIVGEGAGDMERFWGINRLDGQLVLTLVGERPTCHLRRTAEGVWKGAWLHSEKMPIELIESEPKEAGAVAVLSESVSDRTSLADLLTRTSWLYRRVGYDERPMILEPDGRIRVGSASMERIWSLDFKARNVRLVISGEEPTCLLEQGKDGVWKGRWLNHEQMPVELIPQHAASNSSRITDLHSFAFEGRRVLVPSAQDEGIFVNRHEQYVARWLNMQPDEVGCDIGANLGVFTLNAATRVGPGGMVLAFEPVWQNYTCLMLNTLDLPQVKVFHCAMGDQYEEKEILVSGSSGWSGFILDEVAQKTFHERGYRGKERVLVWTLDHFLECLAWNRSLDWIKVDTEGYECAVLQGAVKTIDRYHPRLIIEIHSPEWGRQATAFLQEHGYQSMTILREEPASATYQILAQREVDRELAAYAEALRTQQWVYRRVGYDERMMSMESGGIVGLGRAAMERFWCLTRESGGCTLTLLGVCGDTCHLSPMNGDWCGTWLHHEKMPIELLPATVSIARSANINPFLSANRPVPDPENTKPSLLTEFTGAATASLAQPERATTEASELTPVVLLHRRAVLPETPKAFPGKQSNFAFCHGIVVVNRLDLLRKAVDSVRALWSFAFILDNSADGITQKESSWPVPVIRPCQPLTCFQSMNLLAQMARDAGCRAFGYQHNDAEAGEGVAEKFLAVVRDSCASGRPWGVIYTNYDILSAYNMVAVNAVGPWDTNFTNYFGDNDWFRRMQLVGFTEDQTGLAVQHHNVSSTIKSDHARWVANQHLFPGMAAYYAAKWGGPPGAEQYRIPFNHPEVHLPPNWVYPDDVSGWLHWGEGAFLADLALGKRVLESGTYCGLSAICMAQTALSLDCVDPFDGRATPHPRDTYPEFTANCRRYGVANRVTAYRIPFAEGVQQLTGGYDLVFIDDDHSVDAVRQAIALARQLIKPGGLLAFHDYGDPVHVGVKAAVDEWLASGGELRKRHASIVVVAEGGTVP